MTEEKSTESVKEKATDLVKSVWLAGLGAYGKTLDSAQGQIDTLAGKVKDVESKTGKNFTEFFDNLIVKGKSLEESSQGKFSEAKEKASVNYEEMMSQLKSGVKNMGSLPLVKLGKSASSDQLKDISTKLDEILEQVSTTAKPKAKRTASAKKVSEPAE
ncbi:MAG: phasin family protein [Cellvibrionales bacterium]|nr:phasin family protein [Cellvibrionales bacterium]